MKQLYLCSNLDLEKLISFNFLMIFNKVRLLVHYFFINRKKRDTYFYRMFGFVSALTGKNSFLRPNLDN